MELIRAAIFHTTGNPTYDETAFAAFDDGALVIEDGRVLAIGDFSTVRPLWPDVTVTDWRGGFVLPGLIDAHVHFPQVRALGHLGLSLLDWLEQAALPEEARMGDLAYAERAADAFVRALVSHGTTTAAVFGSHFAPAVAALFDAAARAGLRISTGLVLGDRNLRADLHSSLESAYLESTLLIERFHGHGRSTYAVTPRFALSCTEGLLDVCQTLRVEHPTVAGHSHINEQVDEIVAVGSVFPWARDYLAIYERFGMTGPRTILAHNVHPTASELERLASSGTTVAHCPCSNAVLGSGVFPFARHIDQGVRCALGTDVGAGLGFGVMKEALQAHLLQRIAAESVVLSPAQMLYLATRAGAEALGLDDVTGDFEPGKAADFVYLHPPHGSVMGDALENAHDPAARLSALFALGGEAWIRQVRVEGEVVYDASTA